MGFSSQVMNMRHFTGGTKSDSMAVSIVHQLSQNESSDNENRYHLNANVGTEESQ